MENCLESLISKQTIPGVAFKSRIGLGHLQVPSMKETSMWPITYVFTPRDEISPTLISCEGIEEKNDVPKESSYEVLPLEKDVEVIEKFEPK